MARYAVNRKFQILCKKVNKHLIHDPQLQQHRVRLGATVLWLFQACPGIDSFNAAWVEPLIPSRFPFLLSLLQYMPCSQPLVPLNTNADCMLLSGVLVVMTFEITFRGSGVGVDYRYF